MKHPRQTEAFTLMEILIVVIIVGIIASFALPNYSRTVARTKLQDAVIQLSAIRTANQVYYARRREYWPPNNNQNVSAINSSLSLNIIENGMTFECDGDSATFTCTAVTTDTSPFTVTVTQAALGPTNPQCTSGACP